MGVLLRWALPPSEAGYDYVYIYRATSESGTYSEVTNQSSSDNSYYDENGGTNNYYKIRYYNSSTGVYSGYSSALSVSSLTVTYCSADDIARKLQVDEFGGEGSTTPSLNDVEEMILDAQDEIDQITHHAWRSTTVADEYHDLNDLSYDSSTGWPIYSKHRKIKTLSSSDGDKLEVWDGSNWTDWIASSDYTEGRDEDYWVDYKQGVFYIKSSTTSHSVKAVRLTYRYGETSVPKDIRKACALMVCIEILENNDRTLLVPEGEAPSINWGSKIDRWQERIDKILSSHAEVLMIYGN